MDTTVLNIINLAEGRVYYNQATVQVLLHCFSKDGLIIAFEKKNKDNLSLFTHTTVFHAQIPSHTPFRAYLSALEIRKCITSHQILSTVNSQAEALVEYYDKTLAHMVQSQSACNGRQAG